MARTPGTRLGPYEVLAAIGKGGMGSASRSSKVLSLETTSELSLTTKESI